MFIRVNLWPKLFVFSFGLLPNLSSELICVNLRHLRTKSSWFVGFPLAFVYVSYVFIRVNLWPKLFVFSFGLLPNLLSEIICVNLRHLRTKSSRFVGFLMPSHMYYLCSSV